MLLYPEWSRGRIDKEEDYSRKKKVQDHGEAEQINRHSVPYMIVIVIILIIIIPAKHVHKKHYKGNESDNPEAEDTHDFQSKN